MKVITLLTFFMMLVLWSCEKDIDINIKKQPKQLVAYSFIYPDSAFKLFVGLSENILALNNYQLADNPVFEISKNNISLGTFVLPTDDAWSLWPTIRFEAGDSIAIKCYQGGGDTIYAKTFVPITIPIDHFEVDSVSKTDGFGTIKKELECKLTLTDVDPESNYFQINVIRKSSGVKDGVSFTTNTFVVYNKTDQVFFQHDQSGSVFQGLDFQGLFDDYLFNNSTYTVRFTIDDDLIKLSEYEQNMSLTFMLSHLSSDYYLYLKTKIISNGYQQVPVFDPLKVHNNISGGLGLFSSLNFQTVSLLFSK